MPRSKPIGPRDTVPEIVGDRGFAGVNDRLPVENLPPGLLAGARNNRCRQGVAGTRGGRYLPMWLNRLIVAGAGFALAPWRQVFGWGRFRDPASREWTYIATPDGIFRCREGVAPQSETLPVGVAITDEVTLVQAFGQLVVHRGRYHNTLVLDVVGGGFTDQVTQLAAVTAFAAGNLFTDGPWLAATATYAAGVVTVTTSGVHGYVTGQSVRVRNSTIAGYNGRWTVTATGEHSFTYAVNAVLVSPATGTITVSAQEDAYIVADAPVDALTLTGITRSGATATATLASVTGLVVGNLVAITNANQGEYNGIFAIANLVPTAIAATRTTALAGANNDLVFTAVTAGTAGNAITVAYVNPGTPSAALSVSVASTAITVHLATDPGSVITTTAAQVTAAIAASGAAAALVTSANAAANDGTGVVTALGATALTGGAAVGFDFTVVNAPTTPATTATALHAAKVGRTYTAMGNGLNGIFASNHVWLPTNYLPGSSATTAGSYALKRDYLAVADLLDPQRFTLSDEFRINQGDESEIQCVVVADETRIVVLKGTSVYTLYGVSASLTALLGRTSIPNYGVVNPYAAAATGKGVAFVSGGRGIVVLIPSGSGELLGSEIPLSDAVLGTVRRIDWTLAALQRLTYWNNKLYWAVAVDGAECQGGERVQRDRFNFEFGSSFVLLYLTGTDSTAGLVENETYEWTNGTNASEQLVVGADIYSATTRFTFTGQQIYLRWSEGSLSATSSLRRVFSRVNNALLVFDYSAPATSGDDVAWRGLHPAGQWQGVDDTGLGVARFGLASVGGRERLLAVLVDGSVAVLEELGAEDQVWTPVGLDGTAQEPIEWEATTRSYTSADRSWARGQTVSLAIGTCAPDYSVYCITEGVGEERTVQAATTHSATKYRRPAWKPEWDSTNVNRDFATPYREDYAIELVPQGVVLGGGLALGLRQQTVVEDRLPAPTGRGIGYRILNTTGRIELSQVTAEVVPASRRFGKKV